MSLSTPRKKLVLASPRPPPHPPHFNITFLENGKSLNIISCAIREPIKMSIIPKHDWIVFHAWKSVKSGFLTLLHRFNCKEKVFYHSPYILDWNNILKHKSILFSGYPNVWTHACVRIRAVEKTAILTYTYAHLYLSALSRKNNARETGDQYYDI